MATTTTAAIAATLARLTAASRATAAFRTTAAPSDGGFPSDGGGPDGGGGSECGDGVCDVGECSVCEKDCPGGCTCAHDECTPGELLDPSCGECAAQVCAVDPFCCTVAWDGLCVGEAEAICGLECEPTCGDGLCDPGEDPESCPGDCPLFCGDGQCTPGDETCVTCAEDCGACECGDGACDLGECASCEQDCPDGCSCPHDVCTEGPPLDPACGACEATVCEVDLFCCLGAWDDLCTVEARDLCGVECRPGGSLSAVQAGAALCSPAG